MKKSLVKISFLVLLVISVVGCNKHVSGTHGSYNKLLRSTDYDAMYQASLDYFNAGRYKRTVQLLTEVWTQYEYTPRGDTMSYYVGLSYYRMQDYDMSRQIFDEFRQRFGRSPFLQDVEYCYTMGFYYQSPEPNRDQTATREAIMAIDEFLSRYPDSPHREELIANMEELYRKLHDKVYINAKLYYTIGSYKSAIVALKNAINQYPESTHREEMMYLIAKSSYLYAENSIPEMQRDRYMDMMDAYYNFVSEYSDSGYASEVEKMRESTQAYLSRFSDGTNTEIEINEE